MEPQLSIDPEAREAVEAALGYAVEFLQNAGLMQGADYVAENTDSIAAAAIEHIQKNRSA